MMQKLNVPVFKHCLMLGVVFSTTPVLGVEQVSFYEEKPKGFLWYNEDSTQKEDKPKEEESERPTASQRSNSKEAAEARARNQKLSQELDDAIQIVADKPTVENAIKAQRLQKQVMDRSEKVSESWVLASLLDAGLMKAEDNPNVLHRELQKGKRKGDNAAQLKTIAEDWGIIFYWMKQCIHCERFIPIIQEVKETYGFQVLAVSESGETYGPFEGKKDSGMMVHLNPEGVAPLLFLVYKNGQTIYPIARGITDFEQISENILMVVKHHKEAK